jgi:UDP-N-acetylmuramoyl-tripeptide--D-alanyl-D-alanine ligase
MNLRLDEISNALQGTLDGSSTREVSGYSIDTRTLKPGDLFFAVKGPRFDGHDFVAAALEKGAAGAVIENGRDATPTTGSAIIRVASAPAALAQLALHVRRLWGRPIIGVTGSAGKTTTKEMIAAVLSKKYSVLRSIGNLNNEFGLPLCLLRVNLNQTIGVLEMGMSARGEIRRLAAIAEPNEGVVTNVNPVHLEFFESIDGIAEAKRELVEGLIAPGTAYLNNDDPRVRAMAQGFGGKVVTYGVLNDADFRATQVGDLGLGGSSFTVAHEGSKHPFVLPLLGQHNVINAVAAIAVGATHDVAWSEIQSAISEIKPEKMRGEIVRLSPDISVINDSYNSNPKALTEMIRFLGRLPAASRKVVVAGEMLELGKESEELHRACGREAAAAGVSLLIAVQGMAREILEGARTAGMEASQLIFAETSQKAGEILAARVRQGDVILVKGSRGVKLEEALNPLKAAFQGAQP